jgi:CDP-glucose 4,6-dehydratase
MKPDWWRGKKVFITGHTGFKGAWLCLLLRQLEAQVRGYSLPAPTNPSLFELAKIKKIVPTVIGDVRDLPKLTSALKRSKAEIVIHMAAQSLVRESYRNPVETYSTNVMGTVNILEAIRAAKHVRAAIIVTSDKCYENRETGQSYREDCPMGGHDPYSNSKGCAELVTAAYRDSFFKEGPTAIASARAGNVIGGGDWAGDRLIPDIVRAFGEKKPVIIRNPNSVRPWQLVLEPLAGYLALAEALFERGHAAAEAWNFGPAAGDARPVSWIVDRLVKQWGDTAAWNLSAGKHPHEAHFLKLDARKARSRLGWKPRTNLATALDWIVEWYRRWSAGEDARKLSEMQIVRFLKRGN